MLERVEVGSPQREAALTLFPLVMETMRELPYRHLREAIEDGEVEITEKGSGNVGEIVARNRGPRDVLVLDGEQLVGAKQNRTTSRTILLPARTDTTIPVSCMEQGRWHFQSGRFEHAPSHSPPDVRREAREVEVERTASAGTPSEHFSLSDLGRAQHAVWSKIDRLSEALEASSTTGDLGEVYRKWKDRLGALSEGFPGVDGQVGLVVFHGRKPLGLDLIGGQDLYGRVHGALLRGYLLEFLREEKMRARRPETGRTGGSAAGSGPEPDRTHALDFLIRVADARLTEVSTAGRGSYLVLSGGVVGAELRDPELESGDEGAVGLVHLSAFGVDG